LINFVGAEARIIPRLYGTSKDGAEEVDTQPLKSVHENSFSGNSVE
jgi:hypothetical protein